MTLEKILLRTALELARSALIDVYLPGPDALEPYQHAVTATLGAIDALEVALLDLELAVRDDTLHRSPF